MSALLLIACAIGVLFTLFMLYALCAIAASADRHIGE